jgi:hypothetical protein
MRAWRTHRAASVHFDRDCASFASYHRKRDLQEIDTGQLKSARFCKRCTPFYLWESIPVHHSICDLCHQKRPRPCAHNGGVAVIDVCYYGDRRVVQRRWRWPEYVFGAPLADPSILV